MAIAAELLAAYRATDFIVFDAGEEWALHVGAASARVDARLDRYHTSHAVIVTAFNPRSRALTPHENALRHLALVRLLQDRALPFLLGEGRDPAGAWAAETECIVFGISLAEGLEIAAGFDQNAIVLLERGQPPRLEFTEG